MRLLQYPSLALRRMWNHSSKGWLNLRYCKLWDFLYNFEVFYHCNFYSGWAKKSVASQCKHISAFPNNYSSLYIFILGGKGWKRLNRGNNLGGTIFYWNYIAVRGTRWREVNMFNCFKANIWYGARKYGLETTNWSKFKTTFGSGLE